MGIRSIKYLLKGKHRHVVSIEIEEDFLKSLYHESREQPLDSLSGIAKSLGLDAEQLAQVVGALILKDEISAHPFGLTDKGYRRTLKLIRAHRIYEKYLAEHSGYKAEDWHRIANRMEHHISQEEQDRIASQLRNPLFDPHGDPIPNQSLLMPTTSHIGADRLQEGKWYRVVHIEDDDVGTFRLIDQARLAHQSIIYIDSIDKQNIRFTYEGARHTLPYSVAKALTMIALDENSSEVQEAKSCRRLSELAEGEEATIVGLSPYSRGAIRRRLMDLGFVKGSTVCIEMNSPMANPTAYLVRGSIIALRADQAESVLISK